MIKNTFIADLLEEVKAKLPKAGQVLCQEVPELVEECVQKTLHTLDLVTKKEFDLQKTVLKRMQDKIASLEEKLRDRT